MEETKTSKINLVIAKFKALKRPYQIAIAVGIVAVIVLVFLLSSPKTPFDGLKDSPKLETIEKRYGEESDIQDNTLRYDNYKWLGYNGHLKIYMERTGFRGTSDDWSVWRAQWVLDDDEDTSKAFTKICDSMNRKFGKGEREAYSIVWQDKYGHKYTLFNTYAFILVFDN